MLTKKEIEVLLLRKQGLTQLQTAKRLSISQAAVSKFEQNARAKAKDAAETVKLAQALGIEQIPDATELLQLAGSNAGQGVRTRRQGLRGGGR